MTSTDPPRLRRAVPADLPAITAIYNHAVVHTTATFDTTEKTLAEQEAWLAHHGDRHPVFVHEEAGEVLGWASLSPWSDRCAYAGSAEVSVYVDHRHRGRGLGRVLVEALIAEARAIGLHTLLSRIAEGSDASVHLHERLGFRRVGTLREVGRKFGRWLGVYEYQLLLDRPEGAVARRHLQAGLRELGVEAGDTVMAHAAIGTFGDLVGGPQALVEALLEAVGPSGTLLAYVGSDASSYHSARWSPERTRLHLEDAPGYDPERTPACRGFGWLAEVVRAWPGARRSRHPDGSFAAVGARAEWLTDEHPLGYGLGPGSPLDKLCRVGGKVLLLGAPLDSLTLIHHAENLADIPGKRVHRYPMVVRRGEVRERLELEEFDSSAAIAPGLPDDYFGAIGRDALAAGVGRAVPIGPAPCHAFEAAPLRDFAVAWLERVMGRPGAAPSTGPAADLLPTPGSPATPAPVGIATGGAASSPRVRPTLPEDAAALAALSTELGYPATPEEAAARRLVIQGRPDHLLRVAELEGEVVGYVHAHECLAVDVGPWVEIEVLVVTDRVRSRGVGARLVSEVEVWARERGHATVRVRSRVERERAHAFYRRLGYAPGKAQLGFKKNLTPA